MTLRELTKNLYLCQLQLEIAIETNWVTKCVLTAKYYRITQIPVSVFKPYRIGVKLGTDQRRYKRYIRIKNKGATIVKPNTNINVTIESDDINKLIADMGIEVTTND